VLATLVVATLHEGSFNIPGGIPAATSTSLRRDIGPTALPQIATLPAAYARSCLNLNSAVPWRFSRQKGAAVVTVGVLARLEAKPGKEQEVASFLEGALPLAEQEEATSAWFAIRLGPSTFGIFDVFPDGNGREAHLAGPIATALMQKADELLSEPPTIEQVDILASKFTE
jgi:quinol monooxygenase YgiN